MTNSNKDSVIEEIISVGKRMSLRNYTPGYSGNISVRLGDTVIITTSGSSNGYLTKDNFVEIDFLAKPVDSDKKPSSEKFLHLEYYKQRPEFNAIIHVHPAGLSAFASASKDLMKPVMAENVFYFGGIPLAKYALPSSKELVENTSKYFKDYDAVLMANHGVIIGSKSLEDAYQKLEIAEEYAKTVLYTTLLGGAKELSKKEAKDILSLR